MKKTMFCIVLSFMQLNVECEIPPKQPSEQLCVEQNNSINNNDIKFSKEKLLELIINSIKFLEDKRNYFNQEIYFNENEIISTSSGYILFKKDEKKRKYVKMFYNSPDSKVIIAKHGAITYYDRELKETSKTLIQSSPLGFVFYSAEEALKKQIKILSYKVQRNRIYISISKEEFEDEYGYIELIFNLQNSQLVGWIIHSFLSVEKKEIDTDKDKKIEIKFISQPDAKIELSEFNKFES